MTCETNTMLRRKYIGLTVYIGGSEKTNEPGIHFKRLSNEKQINSNRIDMR